MRSVESAEVAVPAQHSRIRTGGGRAEARPYHNMSTLESRQTRDRWLHGSSGRFAGFAHVVVFVVQTSTA
jgi:hypothetical protein